MKKIRTYALSDRGLVRPENEDNYFSDPQGGVFVVSDGMGGHAAGAVASQIVVGGVPKLIDMTALCDMTEKAAMSCIRSKISGLSAEMREESSRFANLAGMGATLTAAFVRRKNNDVLVANLGDSRTYLIRGSKMIRITRDHSVAQLLLELGQLTKRQAERNPSRNQLHRFAGMPGDAVPDMFCVKTLPGDIFLLCSDGLTGQLSETQILKYILKQESFLKISRNLVEAVKDKGAFDNVTVLLFQV